MKLLLIAPFVCEQSVGEGNSAFNLVSRLGRRFEVTLLTYSLRADPPASAGLPHIRVVEWLDLPLAARFPGLNSQLTPGYVPFYFRARRWLRANLRREGFDLVHQLAPLALRYPCPALGLGVPYLMGPLGGSLEAPPPLRAELACEPLYRRLRRLDRLRFLVDPLLRATYSRARALILVAPYVAELLASVPLPPLRFLGEAGIECPLPRRREAQPARPWRLLYVGRVIRTKGVRDAIHALPHLADRWATLDIVGAGEDLPACKEAVAQHGLEGRVRFHGHLPRSAVDEFYQRSDLFVFPSFREPSGKALLEAMSHGLPVLAVNYGGPAMVVDESCGRLVEPAPQEEFARRIAAQIDAILGQDGLLDSLGQGAQRRISERYTWDRKVEWLADLYRELA